MSLQKFALRFRDWPVRSKVSFVVYAVSLLVLVTATGALFTAQMHITRGTFRADVEALAAIIADNSAAPLAFEDKDVATQTLASLAAKPEITYAAILDPSGKVFAEFHNGEAATGEPRTTKNDLWTVNRPIVLAGNPIGSLRLSVDYARVKSRLTGIYALLAAVVLAASLILVLALTAKLHPFVTRPIAKLADAAREVRTRGDYTVRAPKFAEDELGQLTDAFNSMLAQIQKQDNELQSAHDEVQQQVVALRNEMVARQEAEQKLRDTSRFAGMAEVATGVLHNVGNVLNSVNVSTGLVVDKLNHSKISHVRQAAALLTSHNGDLADFLTRDPKGQQLPVFLSKLGQLLEEENESVKREIEQVARHVEHIKEVVSMQQNYAKVSGVFENFSAAQLVEDALALNAGAFERHGIEVVRKFADVAQVCIDRHKVLQILVNLMRNAKYALDDSQQTTKQLTVRIEQTQSDKIQIVVADNGIGISPENLTSIFAHGFTTRKDGHGFGLHSGANAAREMGGSLRAESEGIGCGATFILELPAAASAKNL